MAKDDYNRIVCIILTYLYARLRGKTEEKPESYLQPLTKAFPVPEEYFYFIIESLLEEGHIGGIRLIKAWGGDVINVSGMANIKITAKGIRYLSESSTMHNVLTWMRDNAVSLPGMVTTVLSILQSR